MQFLNSLALTSSYVLFVISFIPHCQVYCDEVYDKNKMKCFFGYRNDVDPEVMAENSDNKAVKFHEGVLQNYQAVTEELSKTKKLKVPYSYTLLKGCGQVKGMTYLFPKDYFDSTFTKNIEFETDETDKNKREVKVRDLKEFPIEVKIDDETVNVPCYAVVTIPYAYDQ